MMGRESGREGCLARLPFPLPSLAGEEGKKALVILYKYPKTKEGDEAFFDPLVPSVRVRPSVRLPVSMDHLCRLWR